MCDEIQTLIEKIGQDFPDEVESWIIAQLKWIKHNIDDFTPEQIRKFVSGFETVIFFL